MGGGVLIPHLPTGYLFSAQPEEPALLLSASPASAFLSRTSPILSDQFFHHLCPKHNQGHLVPRAKFMLENTGIPLLLEPAESVPWVAPCCRGSWVFPMAGCASPPGGLQIFRWKSRLWLGLPGKSTDSNATTHICPQYKLVYGDIVRH